MKKSMNFIRLRIASLGIAKQTVCTVLIKGIFHCLIRDVYYTFYVLNHNCSLFPNCNNERHFGICLYWFPLNKALKTHTCIPLKLMAKLNFEYTDVTGIYTNGHLYGHRIAYFVRQTWASEESSSNSKSLKHSAALVRNTMASMGFMFLSE